MGATPGLTEAQRHFGVLVGEIREPAPVYRHGTQVGWLFALAHEREMPAPGQVSFTNNVWKHLPTIGLNFASLADLTAWAMWAEATIGDLIGTGDEFLGYGFEGAINEVRVSCSYFTDERERDLIRPALAECEVAG